MPLLCRLSKVMANWMPPSGAGPSSREQRKSSSRSEARPRMEHERADDLVPPVRRQVLEVALRADGEAAASTAPATHARCGAERLTRSTSAWKGRPRWPCANLSCQGSAGMLSGASSISSASNMPLLCRLSKVMA
eukprot:CAMPEP_0180036100 /NCGR_PEP_ID=MMETSP0984-20121128/30698_1 /TAXON_ID=483367 /ORGANISM="non described non described, Strain CCMP 2436" /LENGTH=134 /DNA_ID=CAMNT_0021962155 /DNA_START=628 /DNA_END=1030 /DNA_ORIENTATION=+